MNSVSVNMIVQLLAHGIPIIEEVSKILDISGRETIELIHQGKISEIDVARAIARYVNDLVTRQKGGA